MQKESPLITLSYTYLSFMSFNKYHYRSIFPHHEIPQNSRNFNGALLVKIIQQYMLMTHLST